MFAMSCPYFQGDKAQNGRRTTPESEKLKTQQLTGRCLACGLVIQGCIHLSGPKQFPVTPPGRHLAQHPPSVCIHSFFNPAFFQAGGNQFKGFFCYFSPFVYLPEQDPSLCGVSTNSEGNIESVLNSERLKRIRGLSERTRQYPWQAC